MKRMQTFIVYTHGGGMRLGLIQGITMATAQRKANKKWGILTSLRTKEK